jgi:hypothetical protein
MFDFNKKKISLSILLITLVLITFISKLKIKVEIPIAFDDTIDKNPTEWKEMNAFELFGGVYSYNNTLFALSLFIIISILLFVFTDDSLIRKKVSSLKKIIFKRNVILILITTVVVLVIVKSCGNNLHSNTNETNEEAKAITDSSNYTTQINDTIAAPAAPSEPQITNDTIYPIETNNQNTSNKNKKLTRFQQIKQEQATRDKSIGSYINQ